MNHLFLLATILSLLTGAFAGGLLWLRLKQRKDSLMQAYAERFFAFALILLTAGSAMYVWSFSNSQRIVDFFVTLFLASLLIFNWFSINWLNGSLTPKLPLKRLIMPLRIVNAILIPLVLAIFFGIEWLNLVIIAVLITLFTTIQVLIAIEYQHLINQGSWWARPSLWALIAVVIVGLELLITQDGQTIEPFLSISLPVLFFMESVRILQQLQSSELTAEQPNISTQEKMLDFGLTERESEICLLVLEGLSNKQIAYQLNLSENTVRNHLSHVFPKIGVKKRTELFNRLQPNKQGAVQGN